MFFIQLNSKIKNHNDILAVHVKFAKMYKNKNIVFNVLGYPLRKEKQDIIIGHGKVNPISLINLI